MPFLVLNFVVKYQSIFGSGLAAVATVSKLIRTKLNRWGETPQAFLVFFIDYTEEDHPLTDLRTSDTSDIDT